MKRGIALLLCLGVVFIDFTSRFLSIIIDATFILAALYLLKDYLRQDIGKQHTKKDTESGKSTSTH